MSKIVSIDSKARIKKSNDKREKIMTAFVELVNQEGFPACTNRRIAEKANVSVGAVQYHFSSKTKMLEAILAYSHDAFLTLMDNPELRKGDFSQRATMFTAMAWRYYRSESYLVAIELLMATRAQRDLASLMVLTQQRSIAHLECMRRIFPEFKRFEDRVLKEICVSLDSFLTGLAIQTVLQPKLVNIGGYLRRATRELVERVKGVS